MELLSNEKRRVMAEAFWLRHGDEFRHLYLDRGWSLRQIARHMNISYCAVQRGLKRLRIPPRDHKCWGRANGRYKHGRRCKRRPDVNE